ncbi:hypothetical protein B0T18DRAFT_154821 [Schizothecium vesticola]|uniref:Uncharacterized protein n=1 Tax=Schizothecium vesticola TaxID=314040 RepID=A0AA40EVX1_9PEZI|nr:hypothetical protein B0T18DRAFT_154821 [Schizothecium vesticola]
MNSATFLSYAGVGPGTGRHILPPLRPTPGTYLEKTYRQRIRQPPQVPLTAGPPKGRRTPLPDGPRPREGSDDPSPCQPNPTGHRKAAPRIIKNCSGNKKNGGGRAQVPGDGFINDKAQADPGRKRTAGASVDNSFLEPGDPDPPCALKKRQSKKPKLSVKNTKLSEDDVGELVQRARGSSDATIGDDTSGPVERNGAASVNQNVVGELGQHDVAVGETITVRGEPETPENLIGDSSGQKDTQAEDLKNSGKEPDLPEVSSIATGSSVPKV